MQEMGDIKAAHDKCCEIQQEVRNLYNKLVDLYDYFTKRHIDIQSKEKELAGIERELQTR